MNIHVANLSLDVIESDLHRMFTPYGEVKSVALIRDKLNNRSKRRAFIDMPQEKEAQKAITNLHGLEIKGKIISVTEVKYDPTFSTHSFRQER